jgi:DNA-binding SARP family transcriptional activator
VTWALTWAALLALPLVLAAKVRFPIPDPLFSSTSPSWLTSPSAPLVEVAAVGAWLAWMVGLVVEVRRHQTSVIDRSSAEPLMAVDADQSRKVSPRTEQLGLDVSRCLTLLDEGSLRLAGPGAKAVLPFICAEWIDRHHDSSIVVSVQLGDDLAGLHDSLPGTLVLGDDNRLLRMVEGELLGRKRRTLEIALNEDESVGQHGLAPLLVLVADVPVDLQTRWQGVLETAPSVGIHVLSVGTELSTTSRLDIEDLAEAEFDPPFPAGTPSLGPLPAVIRPPVLPETSSLALRALDIGRTALLEESTATARPQVAVTKPIRVQVLGPYRIWAHGAEISTGLRSASRELLGWYLLQGEGSSAAAAVDSLWPDTDPHDITKKFWRALGDLRSRLRSPNGSDPVAILLKSAGMYRPSGEEITCDLWDFRDCLDQAQRVDQPMLARDLLHRALELSKGDLFAGGDYPWAMSAASSLKRQTHDAALRLVQLESDAGRSDIAVSLLERAISIEPYAEDLYRSLMELRLQMGTRDSAAAVYDELSARLSEIGSTPAADTLALLPNIH